MPAANPGNRTAMEAALGRDLLASLRELCRALGVRPDRWHLVPALARPFETAAALRLAERVQESEGGSWRDAITDAAVQLNLNPDTVESRSKRWPLDAYDRAA